jgi:integrase
MLTETKIRASKSKQKPYKLADGKGLHLTIAPEGGRWWRLRYRHRGKEKMLSLGTYPEVGLAAARERRDSARKLIADGVDPSAERKASKALDADTFEVMAREFMDKQRRKVTESTWQRDMDQFERIYFPTLGAKAISSLAAPDLLTCLRRVEKAGNVETAHRARGLAGRVFRYAIALGKAKHDVAADLRGALEPAIKRSYPAITDPAEVGALMRAIDGYTGHPVAAAALRLAPLLFVRPGELRKAEWAEFDLDGEEPMWRIPAEKMKARREHLVPLCARAVAILKELKAITGRRSYVFPAIGQADRPMSENTLGAALLRMGYAREVMVAHGFRSMASTLLNEQGWHPDVIELQLAHKDKDETRRTYNRAARLPDRRKMMTAWADYLYGLKARGDVIPMRRRA